MNMSSTAVIDALTHIIASITAHPTSGDESFAHCIAYHYPSQHFNLHSSPSPPQHLRLPSRRGLLTVAGSGSHATSRAAPAPLPLSRHLNTIASSRREAEGSGADSESGSESDSSSGSSAAAGAGAGGVTSGNAERRLEVQQSGKSVGSASARSVAAQRSVGRRASSGRRGKGARGKAKGLEGAGAGE